MCEINIITKICDEKEIDVIIGIGGGKVIDTTKSVGYYKEIPVKKIIEANTLLSGI